MTKLIIQLITIVFVELINSKVKMQGLHIWDEQAKPLRCKVLTLRWFGISQLLALETYWQMPM